ncbi:related to Hsp90 co-chaperone Cdc37 [Saccharomycodes ludwigii]|uniref:Hsp90 chaperone protein kinase-targeting subunit n=1 Tax=Saccharomycodes ludwigii TaxID=36035 RepID=A0A376B4B0_9ASCO|nr:hypothetical protein SCDLUD_001803 [Saccharomycodes ludwigii]KAH3902015.1 hypothetical protein SCDLUD_001803 [Saccharomycodes ludwigii]SSD59419.1 related to Hsp90 co-chaperone Cdc37 [Saccharomycodes ludwigii]
MVVDYSKWDKIELSDDSDIEVHPNVDKASFVRWKQQSVHEQRAKRNQDIKTLEAQIHMYQHLNKRVDTMLQNGNVKDFSDLNEVTRFLNSNFDKTENSEGEFVDKDIPTYNEMVEDLIEQLKRELVNEKQDPTNGNLVKDKLIQHRAKIDEVTVEGRKKLDQLYKEKALHISSDDIHTGFDSSFINKKQGTQDALKKNNISSSPTTATVSKSELPSTIKHFIDYKDDVMKLDDRTKKLGEIPVHALKESQTYLLNNMEILSEQQKDALVMTSFEAELKGDHDKAYQIVFQSELMSYIIEVYTLKQIPYLHTTQMADVIRMFFEKVFYSTKNDMGKQSFLSAVESRFEHIKTRCKIIKEEDNKETKGASDEQEGVETIQLKSLDESSELVVNLPNLDNPANEEEKKIVELFKSLPPSMQKAVKSGSLDEINKVFADMSIDEAEHILSIFDEANIIGVAALLEDEKEFDTLKEEYNTSKLNDLSLSEEPTGSKPVTKSIEDEVD